MTKKAGLFFPGLMALIIVVCAVSCIHHPKMAANPVKPSDDFYMYVNGQWIKDNPVPPTEPMWGSFSELAEKSRNVLHRILDSAAAINNAPKGSVAQLIGDFYASGMDSAGIEQNGITPLKGELNHIDHIKTAKDVLAETAGLHRHGIFPLFGIMIDQDARKSTEYALYASQGGMGLPSKEYYFAKDGKSDTIRREYVAHIGRMFELMGEAPQAATAHAKTVMDIETQLAGASMSPVELRDPIKTYNKWSVGRLKTELHDVDWDSYMHDAGIPHLDSVIISQPEFFKKVDKMLGTVPVADWQAYLRWHLIHSTSWCLGSQYVNESFNFFSRKLYGVKALQPRWKRVQRMTDMALGDALGQEYVRVAFSPEARQKVLEIINNLKAALKDRIGQLTWMSPETKKAAMEKLNTLVVKIGFPDKWKNYNGLDISRKSYVVNVMKSDSFEYQRNMAKLNHPVDRTEWIMTPPTINAYYNPTMNEIVFPAGILQAPFFDPKADDALNYGAIGAVIGHELTHGYDDQGRLYDAQGNLRTWWTPQDQENFNKKAQAIVRQFNTYHIGGDHVNGELTLGENIADLGGLTIAYAAFKKSQAGKPDAGLVEGATPDQRFFIGWARVWRSNETPEFMRQLIKTNPHSPARFRVNGPLSNMEAFYKAFDVKPGNPMMAPDSLRSQIW